MESRSRAAPLIREVLPDSFSKHFSKETGCSGSKLGDSHEKCHCFQRQSTAQDGRCQTLLDPVVNPFETQFCLQGPDKPKRVKVVPSCQPPSLSHIPGETEPPSPQQPRVRLARAEAGGNTQHLSSILLIPTLYWAADEIELHRKAHTGSKSRAVSGSTFKQGKDHFCIMPGFQLTPCISLLGTGWDV